MDQRDDWSSGAPPDGDDYTAPTTYYKHLVSSFSASSGDDDNSLLGEARKRAGGTLRPGTKLKRLGKMPFAYRPTTSRKGEDDGNELLDGGSSDHNAPQRPAEQAEGQDKSEKRTASGGKGAPALPLKGQWVDAEKVLKMEQNHSRELRLRMGQWDNEKKLFEMEQDQCRESSQSKKHKDRDTSAREVKHVNQTKTKTKTGKHGTRDTKGLMHLTAMVEAAQSRQKATGKSKKKSGERHSSPSWVEGHRKAKEAEIERTRSKVGLGKVNPFKRSQKKQKKGKTKSKGGRKQKKLAALPLKEPAEVEKPTTNDHEGSPSVSEVQVNDDEVELEWNPTGKSCPSTAPNLVDPTLKSATNGETAPCGVQQQGDTAKPVDSNVPQELSGSSDQQGQTKAEPVEEHCKESKPKLENEDQDDAPSAPEAKGQDKLRHVESKPRPTLSESSQQEEKSASSQGQQDQIDTKPMEKEDAAKNLTKATASVSADEKRSKKPKELVQPRRIVGRRFDLSNASRALKLLKLSQQQHRQQVQEQEQEQTEISSKEEGEALKPVGGGGQRDSPAVESPEGQDKTVSDEDGLSSKQVRNDGKLDLSVVEPVEGQETSSDEDPSLTLKPVRSGALASDDDHYLKAEAEKSNTEDHLKAEAEKSNTEEKEIQERSRNLNLRLRKVANVLQGSLRKQKQAELSATGGKQSLECEQGESHDAKKDSAAEDGSEGNEENKEAQTPSDKEASTASEEGKSTIPISEEKDSSPVAALKDQKELEECKMKKEDNSEELEECDIEKEENTDGEKRQSTDDEPQDLSVLELAQEDDDDEKADSILLNEEEHLTPAATTVTSNGDEQMDLRSLMEKLRRINGQGRSPNLSAVTTSRTLSGGILRDPEAPPTPGGETNPNKKVWFSDGGDNGRSHAELRLSSYIDDILRGVMVRNKKALGLKLEELDSFSCGTSASSACDDTDTAATESTAGWEEEVMDYDSITDTWISVGWREKIERDPQPYYSYFCCGG